MRLPTPLHALCSHSLKILTLAWPILIGQLAVIAHSFIDTAMTARYSALDLAALAIGASIYISVFVGLMGVLQALSPIIAQQFGARQFVQMGVQVRQGLSLALILSALGCSVLWFPQPFLHLADAAPALANKTISYLHLLALALPAQMLFRVYVNFNNAVSRPRAVMLLQVFLLLLKVPLNFIFIYGVSGLGIAEMGGAGCAVASVILSWLALLIAFLWVRADNFYRPFEIFFKSIRPLGANTSHLTPMPIRRVSWRDFYPRWQHQKTLLILGIPMGLSYLIEVTAFTFMSIFVARLGTVALAGHQITANFGTIMYMLPLALASATSTLVAQALGAQHTTQAKQIGIHGIVLTALLAMSLGLLTWCMRDAIIAIYTYDVEVQKSARALFLFIAFYQLFDATQICAAFVLRAYKVASLPTIIYAVALWGVGLGAGVLIGLNLMGNTPFYLQGAAGFWAANSMSLMLAAGAMLWLFGRVSRNP